MYTALVLDDASVVKLVRAISPDGYDEIIAHHMTICMGVCPEDLDISYQMKVVAFGTSEKVLAVKVETTCPSDNKIKHITVCVNRKKGGKPFDSNKIEDWIPCKPFVLLGHVRECD